MYDNLRNRMYLIQSMKCSAYQLTAFSYQAFSWRLNFSYRLNKPKGRMTRSDLTSSEPGKQKLLNKSLYNVHMLPVSTTLIHPVQCSKWFKWYQNINDVNTFGCVSAIIDSWHWVIMIYCCNKWLCGARVLYWQSFLSVSRVNYVSLELMN